LKRCLKHLVTNISIPVLHSVKKTAVDWENHYKKIIDAIAEKKKKKFTLMGYDQDELERFAEEISTPGTDLL